MISSYIQLLRPHQWLKNTFVFLPLFFGQQLLNTTNWLPIFCAFFSFCFASSGVYCLNDICDVEADKKHLHKRERPIASGKISKICGYVIMSICWGVAFAFILLGCGIETKVSAYCIGLLSLYVIINIAYSFRLKYVSIVDVFIIALGFVFRVVLGGIIIGIALSNWIVLMTFLLCLFIALAKRRDDVIIYEQTGEKLRSNINQYNSAFINMAICIVASITMVCYILYTVSIEVVERIGSQHVYMTSIFVLAGILRFIQIAVVDKNSGSPTKIILTDRFIIGCIVSWLSFFTFLLYF